MDAPANEKQRARLTSLVEVCREDYFRVRDAGNHVTVGERAEGRTAYQAALERLSRFIADTRGPSPAETRRDDRGCSPLSR
jgi:hypothetical protein